MTNVCPVVSSIHSSVCPFICSSLQLSFQISVHPFIPVNNLLVNIIYFDVAAKYIKFPENKNGYIHSDNGYIRNFN